MADFKSHAYQTFKKFMEGKVASFDKLTKGGQDSFVCDIQQMDSFGNSKDSLEKTNP